MADPQGSAPATQVAEFRSDGVTANTGLRIQFFTDAFSRNFGLPDVRLKNLITEPTPLREQRPYAPLVGLRDVHYSRPGLVSAYTFGSGPIRGLVASPPGFGGGSDFSIVSKNTVYNEAGDNIGPTIIGTDLIRHAISDTQICIVSGGAAYVYPSPYGAGNVYQRIINEVLPPVSDVAWLSGRFVFLVPNSSTFYYSELGDASNETGLDFASAESSPDPNVAVAVLNDELVFFGQKTVEFWSVTSDANAPYQPNTGRGFQRGCLSRDSVAFADNSLFWVGDNRVVYRVGGSVPQRISSSSIEDKLRQCTDPGHINAWVGVFEGHEIYVLNIPGVGSYAYDCSRIGTAAGAYGDSYERGEWSEWSSFGRTTFRGQCAMAMNDVTLVGDDTTHDVWAMTVGAWTDGGDPLTREASAFIKVEEGTPRCDNIVLHGVMGQGNAVDPGASPLVELRWSDDLGRTFSRWRSAGLGKVGDYSNRAFWSRLGCMRAPGRLVQVRCSDPVNFVASHLELNAMRPAT